MKSKNTPNGNTVEAWLSLALSACLIVTPVFLHAQAPATESFMDRLQNLGEVTVELQSDFTQLRQNRRKYTYQPATLDLQGETAAMEQEVLIRPRGKYRCIRCDTPPIKVKLSKDGLSQAGLNEWNELKFVIPCKPGEEYQQWVLKEYLTYRLYNLLTDRSFRVKLIDLTMTDAGQDGTTESVTGFIMEHAEEVAARLNGQPIDTSSISATVFSQQDYLRFQVFQFMIGNTDWLPLTCHNIELIQTAAGELIPIPFDFDFAGIVNTNYATPQSSTNLTSIRERFFMGNDRTTTELNAVFAQFREKKQAMIDLIDNFKALDKKERKDMISYLESFFILIDNSNQVAQHFVYKPAYMPGIF